MSLEKIREKLEAQQKIQTQQLIGKIKSTKTTDEDQNENYERHQRTKRRRSPPVSVPQDYIMSNIGDISIQVSKPYIDGLFQKIWTLDLYDNKEIDEKMMEVFKAEARQFPIQLDKALIFQTVRNNAFFKLKDGKLIPYETFRQKWNAYVTSGQLPALGGKRKEFIQFMTNKFKTNWVNGQGIMLSEEEFQILYRLEREPKGMERIFDYIEDNFFRLIESKAMDSYLKQMRMAIAKILKDELMNFEKFPKKEDLQ